MPSTSWEAEGANFVETSLAHLSPKDKPWDTHKRENRDVLKIYAASSAHIRKAERMRECSGALDFGEVPLEETGEVVYKLIQARFCRVRYCPICQWRRALLWHAKFCQALPAIIAAHPTARYLFLTLTVRTCSVGDLRATLRGMSQGWNRFVQRKEFASVLGWVRTTEVTRGADGSAHPHYHIMMMVPASYFTGAGYVRQDAWRVAWRESMRLDYDPVIDVRAIYKKDQAEVEETGVPKSAIAETLKYSVKPGDMTADPEWFLMMTAQTHRLRFIATGGVFRDVLKPDEKITDEDMIRVGDVQVDRALILRIMRFLWQDKAGGYYLEQTLLPGLGERGGGESTARGES